MTQRFLVVTTALLVATLVAQKSAALSTLPGNLQDDRATLQQDEQLLQNVVCQLQTDEAAGNSSAVEAGHTALRIAQIQITKEMENLRQDAESILQADAATLTGALWQLRANQIANKTGAIAADHVTVAAAERQLLSDREAIFGGLDENRRPGHWFSARAVVPDCRNQHGPRDGSPSRGLGDVLRPMVEENFQNPAALPRRHDAIESQAPPPAQVY